MFGLDKISWTHFFLSLLYGSGAWYAGLLALARIKGQDKNKKSLFEEDQSTPFLSEGLKPITVFACDYPSELVPPPFGGSYSPAGCLL